MTVWFPVFLVLFEFATYISNDMVMPAMPAVIRAFGAPPESITFALSAALAGSVAPQWFLGPLSDSKGRRTIMLAGAALFVASCVAMVFAQSMEAFFALRFVQGTGVAFVAAVGYPAIHEAFDEVRAVKTVSVMASVSLFAPLLGPLLGALVIEVSRWQTIFALIGSIAAIALIGMYCHMPRTAMATRGKVTLFKALSSYRALITEKAVIFAAIAMGAVCLPFMTWIALGPVILMTEQHLGPIGYAVRQLPVILAMSAGCLIVGRLAGSLSLTRLAAGGLVFTFAGAVLMAGGRWWGGSFWDAAPGFVLYGFGLGAAYTSIYRLALFSGSIGKGAAAAALNSIIIIRVAAGVECLKYFYVQHGDLALIFECSLVLVFACLIAGGSLFFMSRNMKVKRSAAIQ